MGSEHQKRTAFVLALIFISPQNEIAVAMVPLLLSRTGQQTGRTKLKIYGPLRQVHINRLLACDGLLVRAAGLGRTGLLFRTTRMHFPEVAGEKGETKTNETIMAHEGHKRFGDFAQMDCVDLLRTRFAAYLVELIYCKTIW